MDGLRALIKLVRLASTVALHGVTDHMGRESRFFYFHGVH